MVAMLLLLFPPVVKAEEEYDAVGTITYIQGFCQVKNEDGEYKGAKLDQTIYAKQTLKTLGRSEAEVALFDGNVIRITEDSETVIDSLQIRENRYTNIGLLVGSIKLFIKKFSKNSEEFTVDTATVLAGVRGTEFDVSVREDGEVLINVAEGEVETEYDGQKHTITKGNASTFSLIRARRDFKRRIDESTWRDEALDRIRENPAIFVEKMLERERVIIARLKRSQPRMDQYRNDFIIFLKKAQYLEQKKLYRQERALILQEIEKTKKAIGFFIIARRQLIGIRSLIVLSGRIEQELEPETVKQLPSLLELKREYQKVTFIIRKINEADMKLRRVLFVLNRKLDELNKKIGT
jgi:hypothetical protein